MAGLDPAIHQETKASFPMDARATPAHDESLMAGPWGGFSRRRSPPPSLRAGAPRHVDRAAFRLRELSRSPMAHYAALIVRIRKPARRKGIPNMRILFIGDVVGSAGVGALSSFLPPLLSRWNVDLTIVNGE